MLLPWWAALAAVALWTGACGDDDGGGGTDAGTDAASMDGGTDGGGESDGGDTDGGDTDGGDTDGGDTDDGGTDGGTDGGMVSYDMSCTTMAGPPTMVADPTEVLGSVFSAPGIGAPSPLAGATVRAMAPRDDSAAEAATATAGADGSYSIEIATGGMPWMGYLRAEAEGHRTTNLFWAGPFFMTTHDGVNIAQLPNEAWNVLGSSIGQMADMGVALVMVVDCAGTPIAGATVQAGDTADAYTELYSGATGLPDATATATASDGRAVVPNITPGSVAFTATYDGVTFRTNRVWVIADELTTVLLSPHGAEAGSGMSGSGMGGSGMGGSGSGG